MSPPRAYEITPDLLSECEVRFWSRVDRRGPSDCWPWTGSRNTAGYGRLAIGRRQIIATRLALHFDGRPVRPNQVAGHHCDNPACVNPAHLFAGTQGDNLRDMYSKGRRRPQRGSDSPNAKLTPEQVREIRHRAAPRKQLAREYGVSPTTIQKIIHGEKWRHIK